MSQPNRKDTLKFTFDRNFVRPKSYEFECFLEEVVKIGTGDLIGIYFSIVTTDIYVKLINTDLCDRIVESSGGTLKFKHSDGNISEVSVAHAGFGIRTVRIFELPFEVTGEQINAVVSSYGKVLSNVPERWSGTHKFPVLNGIRQLKVELQKHIPSYINVCGYRAIVMYDGQPRTCAGCGATGHVRAQCLQRRVAQLPAGEAVRPTAVTSLPITYAAAITGPPPTAPIVNTSQVNIANTNDLQMTDTEVATAISGEPQLTDPSHDAPRDSVRETIPMEVAAVPTAVPDGRPQTEQSKITSNDTEQGSFPQTGASSVDENITDLEQESGSEKSANSSTSRSSRKRKKRRIARQAAATIAPLLREKAKQVAEKLNESFGEVSGHAQPKPVLTPTGGSVPTNVEAQQSTSVAPHNSVAEKSCAVGENTLGTPFQKSWADETTEDEEMSEIPSNFVADPPVSSAQHLPLPNPATEAGYVSETY